MKDSRNDDPGSLKAKKANTQTASYAQGVQNRQKQLVTNPSVVSQASQQRKQASTFQQNRSSHHTGGVGSPNHQKLLSHSSKNAISKLSIEVVSNNDVKNSISRTAMDIELEQHQGVCTARPDEYENKDGKIVSKRHSRVDTQEMEGQEEGDDLRPDPGQTAPNQEVQMQSAEHLRQSTDEANPNPLKGFYEIYGQGLNALGIGSANHQSGVVSVDERQENILNQMRESAVYLEQKRAEHVLLIQKVGMDLSQRESQVQQPHPQSSEASGPMWVAAGDHAHGYYTEQYQDGPIQAVPVHSSNANTVAVAPEQEAKFDVYQPGRAVVAQHYQTIGQMTEESHQQQAMRQAQNLRAHEYDATFRGDQLLADGQRPVTQEMLPKSTSQTRAADSLQYNCMISDTLLKPYSEILGDKEQNIRSEQEYAEELGAARLAPQLMSRRQPQQTQIVNFLGKQFEAEVPEEGPSLTARMRFEDAVRHLDRKQMASVSNARKSKLQGIQQLLFDNQSQQEKNLADTEALRPPRMDKALYSQQDGVSRLKLPGEQIYTREQIPLVFQSEALGGKLNEIRNQIESNIGRAAGNAKQEPKLGVLGLVNKYAKQRNSRPVSSNPKKYSRIKGLGPRKNQNVALEQKYESELPDQTLSALDSKTGFQFKSDGHTGKSVSQFLKAWANGKAVLPQDWHAEIKNGRITNQHNHGLVVGRKLCQLCRRYRCKHQQFSGGISDQQKLIFTNHEQEAKISTSMKAYQLEFTQNTGLDGVQNRDLMAAEFSFLDQAELPAGAGITEVRPTASATKAEENRVTRRLRSACLVAKGKQHQKCTSATKAAAARKRLGTAKPGTSKGVRSAADFCSLGASQPIIKGSMTGTISTKQSWVSPFTTFKREGLRSQRRSRVALSKPATAAHGLEGELKDAEYIERVQDAQASEALPATLNYLDDATLQSVRQNFQGLPLEKQLELLKNDGSGRTSQGLQRQLVLNTQTGQIEQLPADQPLVPLSSGGWGARGSQATLRSSRSLYVPVEEALAMISQFDGQLRQQQHPGWPEEDRPAAVGANTVDGQTRDARSPAVEIPLRDGGDSAEPVKYSKTGYQNAPNQQETTLDEQAAAPGAEVVEGVGASPRPDTGEITQGQTAPPEQDVPSGVDGDLQQQPASELARPSTLHGQHNIEQEPAEARGQSNGQSLQQRTQIYKSFGTVSKATPGKDLTFQSRVAPSSASKQHLSGSPQLPTLPAPLGQQAQLQDVKAARITQNNSPQELSRNPDYAVNLHSPKPLTKQASDVQPLRDNAQYHQQQRSQQRSQVYGSQNLNSQELLRSELNFVHQSDQRTFQASELARNEELQNIANMKIDIQTSYKKERPMTHQSKPNKLKPEEQSQMQILGSSAKIMRLPSTQAKQLRPYGGGGRARTATAGASKRYSGNVKNKEEVVGEAQGQDAAYGQGVAYDSRGQERAEGSRRAGNGASLADSQMAAHYFASADGKAAIDSKALENLNRLLALQDEAASGKAFSPPQSSTVGGIQAQAMQQYGYALPETYPNTSNSAAARASSGQHVLVGGLANGSYVYMTNQEPRQRSINNRDLDHAISPTSAHGLSVVNLQPPLNKNLINKNMQKRIQQTLTIKSQSKSITS